MLSSTQRLWRGAVASALLLRTLLSVREDIARYIEASGARHGRILFGRTMLGRVEHRGVPEQRNLSSAQQALEN